MTESPARFSVWYHLAIGVPPFILTVYWWWYYAALYRWLAELQLFLLGEYWIGLTFMLTYVALAVPMALLVDRVCRLSRIHPGEVQTTESSQEIREWINDNQGYIMGFGVGGILIVLGLFNLVAGHSAGPWTALKVADLEQGVAPPSDRLILEAGRLLVQQGQVWEESITSTYVPLVSPAWQADRPVAVVARMRDWELTKHQGASFKGSVNPSGLPGHVRSGFEKDGVALIAAPLLLEYGVDRGEAGSGTGSVFGLAAAILLVTSVIWLYQRRRAARQIDFADTEAQS